MRKLSKKISMLMVLAMLVSLFSGIVSASAASSWSFYDRTAEVVVERNETYVMEKNQYANFDLYKDGAEASTKEYKYTWYSDDASVVYVDSTNGRLRAQKDAEAGEKAFIYVLIDNKTTEKNENAKRGFYIEIAADEEPEVEYAIVSNIGEEVYLTGEKYELEAVVTADGEEIEAEVVFSIDGVAITEYAPTKAGEYTIVATATIDGEEYAAEFPVVVEESLPEIVEAKQTSLNTVEIKFDKAEWAKDFAGKIKYSYFAGDLEIDSVIKGAEVKKDADDTVVITLYSAIAKDAVHKFAYVGYDCAATIKGVAVEPAYIKVVGGKVPALTDGKLDVKIYTANGIDITSDELKKNVTYSSTSTDCVVGSTIYFFATGKSAVVNAVYEMGWDQDGNEKKDLEAFGTYVSVDEYTYSNPTGFAVNNATWKADYLGYSNTARLSLSDTGLRVHAKYNQVKYDGTVTARYIFNGKDSELGRTGYTYSSTNDSVILVDPDTGVLSPCSAGTASIVMYYNVNGTPVVVGSFTVKVEAARQLQSFTASITDRKLSADETYYEDETVVKVDIKDQLGDGYSNNVTYKVEVANPAGEAVGNYLDWETVSENGTITGIKFKTSAAAASNIKNKEIKHLTLKITVADKAASWVTKSYTIPVSIKNVDESELQSTVLNVSAASVDMKLNKGKVADYNVTAKLVKQDKDGFDLGLQDYTYITKEAQAVTANNAYSIIIKKNADVDGQAKNALINDEDNVITFMPVTVVSGSSLVTKTGKDTYTIKVFKGNNVKAQVYASKTVSFNDSTSAITAKVENTAVDVTVLANLKAALKFFRGNEITNKIEAVEFKYDGSGNNVSLITVGDKIYVKTISVTVSNSEMNNNFAGSHKEDVVINTLFTKPQ